MVTITPVTAAHGQPASEGTLRRIRIACVLVGVAGLLLKRHYSGPGQDLVVSYGGNVSVSFAVYFMFAASAIGARGGGWVPTVLAVTVVELFEITDGFGVMSNVYDPSDLVANVTGIALAWSCDAVLRGAFQNRDSGDGMSATP